MLLDTYALIDYLNKTELIIFYVIIFYKIVIKA